VTPAKVWKGAESLRRLLVPIDKLQPHPRNPRRGNLNVIAASLDRFGQLRPVVVQESTGFVVAGNHLRRAAAEMLGWTHLASAPVDLDDDAALRYLLMDNRSSDLATYDEQGIVEILRDLDDSVDGLEATGYEADDLAVMVADLLARDDEPRPSADPPEPPETRDVVLTLTPAQHSKLSTCVGMIAREYGTVGQTATIFEAVVRAAKAL
jgi:ParB-like chromosome segregation protein Spo0J